MSSSPDHQPFSFQTLNAARVKQQLMQYFGDHQILPTNIDQFLMREQHFVVGQLNLYQLEFIGGVEFRRIANDQDFILHLLLSHHIEFLQGKHWKRLEAPTAFMLSPQNAPDFRFPNGGRLLLIQVRQTEMQRHARQLFPMGADTSLRFPLSGFLTEDVEELIDTLELLFKQYQRKSSGALRSIWQQQVNQFLQAQILTSLDNNFRRFACAPVQRELPAPLRKACELIQGRLDKPFNLTQLCHDADIHSRNLQYQFKKHFRCSPRTYYLQMKLDALHRDLKSASHGDSVTELALKWGFNHGGRLAQQYQQRFGELPSQTLSR